MQILSYGDSLHEMLNHNFCGKIRKKNIMDGLSTEFTQRVVKVKKDCFLTSFESCVPLNMDL